MKCAANVPELGYTVAIQLVGLTCSMIGMSSFTKRLLPYLLLAGMLMPR